MARLRGSDGYVSLAVLVVSGLLAALVSTLLAVSQPGLRLSRIGSAAMAVDGLLDGGLQTAGYMLFKTKLEFGAVNGTIMRSSTGNVQISVVDEGGRVDLNAAAPELLAGLYKAVAGKSLEPETFAARVVDWRDQNEDSENGGAEAFDYGAAGLSYTPRNAPFRSIGELRLVLGLSADDFIRLEPYVTVYSLSKTVSVMAAPKAVLLAVPNITEGEVSRIIDARKTAKPNDGTMENLISSYGEFLRIEAGNVYRIGLAARLAGEGMTGNAEAVIAAPQAEDKKPFGVVAWSRLTP